MTATPCRYTWCTSGWSGHVDHCGDGEVTANYNGPMSAVVRCKAHADETGEYDDEIFLQIHTERGETGKGETLEVFLTVDEALGLKGLIDTAIANRAEVVRRVGER
jgi:hypothetical protein